MKLRTHYIWEMFHTVQLRIFSWHNYKLKDYDICNCNFNCSFVWCETCLSFWQNNI